MHDPQRPKIPSSCGWVAVGTKFGLEPIFPSVQNNALLSGANAPQKRAVYQAARDSELGRTPPGGMAHRPREARNF